MLATSVSGTELEDYYNVLLKNPFSAGPYVYSDTNNIPNNAELVVVGVNHLGEVVEYGRFNQVGELIGGASIAPIPMDQFRQQHGLSVSDLISGSDVCATLIVCSGYPGQHGSN
ncbi:MAG: hypothetical protein AAF270_02735 [Pseudomonadota bacterium]